MNIQECLCIVADDTIVIMPTESTSNSESPKRAPRKRVSKAVSDGSVLAAPRRKAPTSIGSSSPRSNVRSYKSLYISLGILLIGFGAAAVIGYSDKGQINITGVINERNDRVSSGKAAEGEDSSTSNTIVPVQNNGTGLPDGGLVGTGASEPAPEELAPVEVASSTGEVMDDENASTTNESVGGEEGVEASAGAESSTEVTN